MSVGVTAVVVNYNGRRWLDQCLSSLLEQQDGDVRLNMEVVLVDNASTDDSVVFVQKRFGERVRVVLSDRNGGFAYGTNLGVASARHNIVLLLNADAWIGPTCVAHLVRSAEAGGLDVVAPFEGPYDASERRPGGSPYVTTIDYFGHPYFSASARWRERPSFYLSGACLLFTRALYRETGGMDSNFFMYCEEVDWFWRLNLAGRTFAHVEGPLVHHAGSEAPSTALRADVFLWRNQNTLQMLLKNYSPASLAWVLPGYVMQNGLEALALLALGKPALARTYAQGLAFNLRHLRRTLRLRRHVQAQRVVSDRRLRAVMYPGSAKLAHARGRLARPVPPRTTCLRDT